MENWQVSTAECVGYLHQYIDLFIYLSISLSCSVNYTLITNSKLNYLQMQSIFKTSILSLKLGIIYLNMVQLCASVLCIFKHMHVNSCSQ